ncbi:uncharacterized protein N7484_003758 [Penicillium longicatenatum]|uniref:uncharacterized protein n=1 Tax=Penicillium longicatenatum TaxID=1561947 RepID=UPI0025473099|nr:uncharacterized protein N7484_003758 [Penicillium longicatenatum]KAJ5650035.1 hypothetical protein N7484_003758 [Penicillium longicatenatum]
MRSFFNKPSWAAKGGGTTNEFYRRSEQTYSDIIAANREAHKKPKNPPEADENSSIIHNEVTERVKRPRLSREQNKDAVTASSVPLDEQDNLKEDLSLSACPEELPNAPVTPHHEEHGYSRVLTSNISDRCSTYTLPMNYADQPAPANSAAHSAAGGNGNTCSALSSLRKSPQLLKPSERPAEDPVVQILITSEIPNTKPLLVHRKMSQGLREVRLEWCKRQGLTTGANSPVYLTWRDRRLFDVTTCRTLGIKTEIDSQTSLQMHDDLLTGPKELRIHIKAVTDDPLLLSRSRSSSEVGQPSPSPLSPSNQPNQENEPMKLTFRSPGLSDLKIKARPKTRVSKLISVFRDNQQLSADQEVSLVFDGDLLDPSTCLGDYDIADLDLVDVQIKS